MKLLTAYILFLVIVLTIGPAKADVVSSSDAHFALRHEHDSTFSPEELWQRLISPSSWWHPGHTYSGDAANLSLKAEAGGLWLEVWSGGSVQHGRVLLVQTGKVLRLEAPFGPLQSVGAYVVWTITIEQAESGSRVVFEESAIGPKGAQLGKLAVAVDGVKSEAIQRLATQ